MVDEHSILTQISTLVDQEHELRTQVQRGELTGDSEREQLAALEGALDQCWDLLRQRRAKRQYDDDPDEAQVRPEQQVENYLQ